MIIRMTKHYRIEGTSESWNVQVNCKKKGEGEPRWENEAYFVSLEAAISYVADRSAREIPNNATREEVVKCLAEIRGVVHDALTPFKMAV